MLALKNHFVILFLTLWTTLCNAQYRVYRGDSRSPQEITDANGFLPRGMSAQGSLNQATADVSMFNHATGAADGSSLNSDGYVSTTALDRVAVDFVNNAAATQGNGWVYTIAASAAFINVEGTLGRFRPVSGEYEFAALGGFRMNQVIGWTEYRNGVQATSLTLNPLYQANVFDSARPSGGEPFLAGFPPGHPAWRETPWSQFASCPPAPRLRARQQSCNPRQTAQQAAQQYLDGCSADRVTC